MVRNSANFSLFVMILASLMSKIHPIILNTEILEIFSESAKIKYIITPPFIKVTFTTTKEGYFALSFADKMCPGDVIILTFDRTPKILDGYCKGHLRDTKPDYVYGGQSDWEIVESSKKPDIKGWTIVAKRPLQTRDGRHLDKQFVGEKGLSWISWAIHDTMSDYQKFDPWEEGSSRTAQVRQTFNLDI